MTTQPTEFRLPVPDMADELMVAMDEIRDLKALIADMAATIEAQQTALEASLRNPGPRKGTAFEELPWTDAQRASKELEQAWSEFHAHRRAKRSTMTPHAAQLIVRNLATVSVAEAIAALNRSIAGGWTSVVIDRSQPDKRAARDAATDWGLA